MGKVVVIMGSGSDEGFTNPIIKALKTFGIKVERRVASAHKTPDKLLKILEEYEAEDQLVYVTVAGLSNALSGFVDANTVHPVIACPPLTQGSESIDIFSSLRLPRGIGSLVVLHPENAALAAAKILATNNPELRGEIDLHHREMRERVEKDDERLRN